MQTTDLTWQQLETAAIALGINNLLVITNGKVMIDVSVLLSKTISDKTASGVVEALFDLREIAALAQQQVNLDKQVGERLAAFPPTTSGVPVNNISLQAGLIYVRRPLANTGILGATN